MTTTTPSGGYAHDRTDTDRRPIVRRLTETKAGPKTTEFMLTIVFAVAVIVAAYLSNDDSIGRDDGWLFAGIVVAAYALSRGLAKLGVHEPYSDELERR